MRDALATARTARQQIVDILTGANDRVRSMISANITALVVAKSLSAIDVNTFGLFNNNNGSNDCAIALAGKTLTSPIDLPWTAADVGKAIHISGAGAGGGTLSTTISAFGSAGSVTVQDAAATAVVRSATAAGGIAIWGEPINLGVNGNPLSNAAGDLLYTTRDLPALGLADYAPTINALIGATPSGGIVYLPAGTYVIASEILINKPLTLQGAGSNSTIISRPIGGANTNIIKIIGSGVIVRDLCVVGPAAASYVVEENGILALGTGIARLSDIQIRNVEAKNCGNAGIMVEFTDRFIVSQSRVYDCGYIGVGISSACDGRVCENRISSITPGTAGNAYGAFASQRADGDSICERIVFANNIVYDISLWEAMDTHGGSDIMFSGNVISACLNGIVCGPGVGPAFSHQPRNISIIGNTISKGALVTPSRGIVVSGTDGAHPALNVVVAGNVIDSMGNTGATSAGSLLLQYVDGAKVGGVIKNAVAIALNLFDGVTNFIVSGLAIDGIQTGYGAACGIMLGVGGTACTGHIGDVAIDSTAEYAIYISTVQRGVTWGRIKRKTSNVSPVVGVQNAGAGFENSATLNYNFSSIATGAYDYQDITVAGAELGDYAQVSPSVDLLRMNISAYVSAANVVTFVMYNLTGVAVDLGVADFTAKIVKVAR